MKMMILAVLLGVLASGCNGSKRDEGMLRVYKLDGHEFIIPMIFGDSPQTILHHPSCPCKDKGEVND